MRKVEAKKSSWRLIDMWCHNNPEYANVWNQSNHVIRSSIFQAHFNESTSSKKLITKCSRVTSIVYVPVSHFAFNCMR